MLAATVIGAAPAGADAPCTQPEIGLSIAVLQSRWREQDERGRDLVQESGTLPQLGLRAALHCRPWVLGLQLSQARGTRGYDGVDSGGAAVRSSSRLAHTELKLEAWLPVAEPLLLGGRLVAQQIDRNIASAGAVLGYPERLRYWQAQAGGRAAFGLAPGVQLALDGWLGGGPGGNVAVRLPHADPLTLGLGRSGAAQLGLQLSSSAPTSVDRGVAWGWRMRLQWTVQAIDAGNARPLMRNGAVVGGAAQPRIQQSSWELRLELLGWP